jgi:redox-sensitive bicupin YhaK (pirin superfamily)
MARLDDGAAIHKDFPPGRAGFLQVVDGMIDIEGNGLSAGDGLQFDATSKCEIIAKSEAELMLFDLS